MRIGQSELYAVMKERLFRVSSAISRRFGNVLWWSAFALLAVMALWCFGAFFHAFDVPESAAWAAAVVLTAFLAASPFYRQALWGAVALELFTIAAYQTIRPEQRFSGTVWQKPWKRTLGVRKIAGGGYELRNVRDFFYRTENDYVVRYRSVTVFPEEISSIDIVFSHWDNMEEIAHSMLGLNFADGTTVVISLETRLPEGRKQNGIDGFYRRYGLAMIAGTPEDLYGLRADHRGETLYVYRVNLDHGSLCGMTISFLEQAAALERNPVFYNSLFRNCTTGLLPMLQRTDQEVSCSLRVMLNGLAAKMLYDEELLSSRKNESFGSLRARSLVPGLCCGKDAPHMRYNGASECRWLRNR